jgi:hypothetical protein
MRFKKIALALFACLALGAFAANAAQAAQWTVGTEEGQTKAGTTLTKEGVTCKKHGTTTPLLFTATLLGSEVELSAEGVDCLEKAGSTNPAIINTLANDSGAHSEGVLTFTGVKVFKPSTKCTAGTVGHSSSGELTTEALTDEVIMDATAGSTTVFDKFFPEVAGGAIFTIEFGGAECPLAGDSSAVKGSFCGEAVHTLTAGTYSEIPTGTLFSDQTLTFGKAQQETGGCTVEFGKKDITLDGAVDNTLAGTVIAANKEKPFGAD